MGFFAFHAARRPDVRHVDVVELSADVIRLVWAHLPHEKLSLRQADLATFLRRPATRAYDFIYLDIWPHIEPHNAPEMRQLRDLATRWLAPRGRIVCWGEDILPYRGGASGSS